MNSDLFYHIDSNDFEEILNEGEVSASAQENKITSAIRTSKGNVGFAEESIRKGLMVFEAQYHLNRNILYTGKWDGPLLEMQFNLSREDIFYKNCLSCPEKACPMSGNLIYDPENNSTQIRFAKDVAYKTFDIHLPLSFLKEYAGEHKLLDLFLGQMQKGQSGFLSDRRIMANPKIIHAIMDIKNCVYSGLTRKIYLESKILELIALGIDSLENRPADIKLTDYEKKRILETAQIIREHIASPYTISALAKIAGLNETKLKQGFKLLMGTTIFGYLQEIRMEQAKKYLLDTDLSIQEISHMSGYMNLSNFSAAFKKTFGFSPSSLRKNPEDF